MKKGQKARKLNERLIAASTNKLSQSVTAWIQPHINLCDDERGNNMKEISPESSTRNKREKQAKMKKEPIITLNVISQGINEKTADKPVYLVRYDD
jgi:hypothetical protein